MSELGQTVFLVDDDAQFLKSIQRLLSSTGYQTESFSSARDFLTRCPREATGCVLADLSMPDMDGMALQRALAQTANPLPVVFLTGQGDIQTSVTAMRQGAEDFLVKTAPKETIFAAIERALERDSREREARAHRRELQSRFEGLTQRERQVLSQVMLGRLNKQIAADLGIDERSVKRHRSNLMNKLQVKSVAELAQLVTEAQSRAVK